MTVMSEGLLLNSKYILIQTGREEGGPVFKLYSTATSCKCLPCGLTVIHLRLCDRKKSLGTSQNLNWRGEWRRNCFLSQIISRPLLNSTHACFLGTPPSIMLKDLRAPLSYT